MTELKCRKNSSLNLQERSVLLIKQEGNQKEKKKKKRKRVNENKKEKEMNLPPKSSFGCSFLTSPVM